MTYSPPVVFDGHNDTLLDLLARRGAREFLRPSDEGHLDLPRARESGLGGGFFALFAPSEERPTGGRTAGGYDLPHATPLSPPYARVVVEKLLSLLSNIERAAAGDVRVVRSAAELDDCLREGVFAALLHLEGAEAVAPDLSNLTDLYDARVRSIGLVWARENAFGHGVPFRVPGSPDVGPGLTAAGKRLVAACNDLGIVVDCAHLNERGFWDVAERSDAPLAVTHAGAHECCPSSRNLTDDQLRAVADSGGVVGVTFSVTELRPDGLDEARTPLSTLADHFEHVAEVAGVDHVGFGSDFDGATVPAALGDVRGLPKLFDELRSRGFSTDDLERVANGNWCRLLRETLAV